MQEQDNYKVDQYYLMWLKSCGERSAAQRECLYLMWLAKLLMRELKMYCMACRRKNRLLMIRMHRPQTGSVHSRRRSAIVFIIFFQHRTIALKLANPILSRCSRGRILRSFFSMKEMMPLPKFLGMFFVSFLSLRSILLRILNYQEISSCLRRGEEEGVARCCWDSSRMSLGKGEWSSGWERSGFWSSLVRGQLGSWGGGRGWGSEWSGRGSAWSSSKQSGGQWMASYYEQFIINLRGPVFQSSNKCKPIKPFCICRANLHQGGLIYAPTGCNFRYWPHQAFSLFWPSQMIFLGYSKRKKGSNKWGEQGVFCLMRKWGILVQCGSQGKINQKSSFWFYICSADSTEQTDRLCFLSLD